MKYGQTKKLRKTRAKRPSHELIREFWDAPLEAFFGEDAISSVTRRSVKTLQCDRWRKSGIPFSKVEGKVLYKKLHVIEWLDSFPVCASTSQYESKEG